MPPSRSSLFVALIIISFGLASSPADAYVRTTSEFTGVPLSWRGTSCIFTRINRVGSADVSDGTDLAALTRATENWHLATQSAGNCSYMRFVVEPAAANVAMSYTPDGKNETAVFWIEKDWNTDPDHSPSAAALTTVLYLNIPNDHRDGEIVDADIEINGDNFKYATTKKNGALDIENVLTHELGHVLGLEHPCYLEPSAPSPHAKDHLDQAIPACRQTGDRSILDATMFPSTSFGDIERRTPIADDVAGICAIYPIAKDPGQCGPKEGCCAIAGDGASRETSPLPILLVAVFALLWRLRSPRPR